MTTGKEFAEQALRQAQQAVVLETTRASDVQLKAIDWLWPNRFALGKLGILAGLPDRGKGLITADMCARIINPKLNDWPCQEGHAPFGSVVILSAEDDAADTIVPRLIAAGADTDRVHIVTAAKRSDGTKRTFNLQTDLEALRAKIEEVGDVVFVIIDPLTAYLGVGKGRQHRLSVGRLGEVRNTDYGMREFAFVDSDGTLHRVGSKLP